MRNQSKHARAPQISDFSEALLNAGSGAGESKSQNYEDELQAMLNQENTGASNSNLSNVLNKIRDRGPAGKQGRQSRTSKPRQQQDVVTRFSREALATAEHEQGAQSNAASHATAAEASAPKHGAQDSFMSARSLRQQLPLIFMLIAIVALAAMQFYTDGKLSQLVSTQQFSKQSNDLSINAALDGQQQIAQLQSTIATLGEKVQQLGDKLASQTKPVEAGLIAGLNKLEQKLETLSTQQQNSIATLKKQIAALKASRPEAVAKGTAVKPRPVVKPITRLPPVKAVASTKTTSKSGWSVNLAALSDRQLARKAMQRLKGAGVSPMIEEVELKGKKVYRLRVDGFASRQAAKNFVNKARRYGFDKGWIRKG